MPYAIIFPGQGAAAPGAGKAWRSHPAWTVVEEAEEVLQRPVGRLLLDADPEELSATGAGQLAVLLASLVAWDALHPALEHRPIAFAGHSLGQITALIASGAVERHDGLRLAGERAERSQRSADANPGRMAALVGADLPDVQRACSGVDAWLANDNAPGQVVIAGTPRGVDAAAAQARDLGVRRVLPLDVGHAFHTPLLLDVATGLRPLLDTLAFHEPAAPVVANTDASAHTDPTAWPAQLEHHLVQPVRWRESQHALTTLGAATFVEVGPGRVLAGLARRTVPDVGVLGIATPGDMAACAARLSRDAPANDVAAQNAGAEHVAAVVQTAPEEAR